MRGPPDADVLVVGGGPAGSATAALLSDGGWRVVVLERAVFPRAKPCGECLNPGAVAALGRVGFLDAVRALEPATLDGWEVRSGGARARGDFPGAAGPGLGVARDRLDHALLTEARRRGARVEEGVTVRKVGPFGGGGRALEVRGPDGSVRERRARVVVGADGLRSVVARAVGAHARPPRLRKLSLTARVRGRIAASRRGLLYLSDGTTVGLAPVDAAETLWNLTVVVSGAGPGRGAAGRPLELLLEHARRAPIEWLQGPEVIAGPWASGPFDWPARRVTADGVVLVGDAAGYFDPLTGQGIYRAVHSAELAAAAIDRALSRGRVSGNAFRGYALRSRAAFTPARAVQWAVEHVVSRRRLRDPFVERLAARPAGFDALLAVTGDAAPARSLLGPATLSALFVPPKRG